MSFVIAVLSGDGIGPEVMQQALHVLTAVEKRFRISITYTEAPVGGTAIDKQGAALPQSTIDICKASNAILFGSVGGPQWEHLPAHEQPERAALLPLRKIFGLFANFRPAIIFPQLTAASPLKKHILAGGLDILIVRELTGGIYFGKKGTEKDRAFDTLSYTRSEIERIAHTAFQAAEMRSNKLTSIDKANVLASMVFWREVVTTVGKQYPSVALNHLYVDNAAMQLVTNPRQFDVLLCGNMFGDILSDEAAMLTGSLGMLPSASLSEGSFGLYEPSGGSAPDIAGKGIANPIAQILSAAMLLKYSLKQQQAHDAVFQAVSSVLDEGYRTQDIASEDNAIRVISTEEMGARIAEKKITA